MSSSHVKFFFWLIPVLLFCLCPFAVRAQDSASKTTSVTGCLAKGVESGGYYIAGADGKFWELSGKVDATHVGHEVTVQGHVLHRAPAEEAKYADNEKQEANGKPVADFEVSTLKMISDSCQ